MNLPLADELLVHLSTPDRQGAADYCAGLLETGMSLEALVDDGLAPAMRQVGALWESAVWSTADEHLATAAAEAALSRASESRSPHTRGEVVVACVEGDWHSLPPRMVAEVLVAHGWSVRFLGASQPTRMLVEHLARHRPAAVLLGCAVPNALAALLEAVVAVHGLGLPAYVGGNALTAQRAIAVGADGFGRTAAGALYLLDHTSTVDLLVDAAVETRLAAHRQRQRLLSPWVADAMDELAAISPALTPGARARTEEDLRHLLDIASVGLLLEDPSLLDDECDWLARVHAPRGHEQPALVDGLLALAQGRPPTEAADPVEQVLRAQRARLAA